MRPIVIDLLRGMISGAIIAAGIGIGLVAGSAQARELGTVAPVSDWGTPDATTAPFDR